MLIASQNPLHFLMTTLPCCAQIAAVACRLIHLLAYLWGSKGKCCHSFFEFGEVPGSADLENLIAMVLLPCQQEMPLFTCWPVAAPSDDQ